ncbi:MAG: extracellular solute-binding protein [Calditrichaeota bacterium]|nr:extracellular solute-binding protein [Calditrichota bacterium]MCB0301724.1 extracellular solute-binding protein [Calditrichota bacterium]
MLLPLLLWQCAKDTSNRIVIWTTMRPVERDLLQKKLDEFAATHPQYEFRQLYYQTEELRPNYMISALAGKGPDLIHVASDNVGPLSELKVVKPLEDYFDQAYLDQFLTDPFSANTTLNGHLYQIADRVGNHLTLVYNKKFVKEPPRTIEDLIRMGKELAVDADNDGNPDRYALAWNFIEPYFAVPFIGLYGGWILNDQNQPTLDTKAVANAAQLIYDMANKYKIIPRECDYETANALFLDEKSAMIINGPWSWGTYIKRGMDIGLARIPMNGETGQWATPIVSPVGYMVNVNLTGERLDITLELLRYLTSSETQLAFAREFNLIPARKALVDDSVLVKDPLYQAALDQMKVGRPMPVVTELRWIWDAMRPGYQGIFTGRYTPEEAAKEMQQLAEKLIRENRE